MRKKTKFLLELENELKDIRRKNRNNIVLKYNNLIDEELNNKKGINKILNNLGDVKDIAQREKELLKEGKSRKKKNKIIKIEVIREYDITNSDNEKNKLIEIKEVARVKKKKKKKINLKSYCLRLTKNLKKLKLKSKFIRIVNIIKDKFNKIKNNIKIKINDKKDKILKEDNNNKREEIIEFKEEVLYEMKYKEKSLTKTQFILRILGVILTTILLVAWCFVVVVFISSIFAYLDGVKLIGISIGLFGLVLLIIKLVIILNNAVFRVKDNYKINLFVIILAIFIIAIGISLTIRDINKLEYINDVSEKYTMRTKIETISLPKNGTKMNILFNSEYDTQYIVVYDNSLDDKFKIEVKYFEEYYDYYTKKSNNEVYVSLSKNFRNRLSVYINDIKDGKIFNRDEIKRYIVKIKINKKDFSRLVIQN